MEIEKHKLKDIKFIKSPNFGHVIKPEIIVAHYTAGPSLNSCVQRFSKKENVVSAHLIIAPDGEVIQMVPFNLRANHAGASEYKGKKSVNGFSIGVEFINWGILLQKRNGLFYSWADALIHADDVYTDEKGAHWHKFTEKQVDSFKAVCEPLIKQYNIKDIVGHSDICVPNGRKQDPGNSFPLTELRKELLGK